MMTSKKRSIVFLMVSVILMGLVLAVDQKVDAVDTSYVHFEFRWYSPNDVTYRQQKWTKSAYILNSTTMTRPWYSASAWGHSYLAGGTGNVDVSNGNTYRIYAHKTYYLTNYLVEWYGTGNNAYISANSVGNGNAYGSWHADR